MQCWPNSEVPMILEVYYIIIVLCVSSSHPRLCSLYVHFMLTAYWLSSTSRYIASVSGHSTDHYDFAYPTDNSCDAPSQTLTNSHMPACFWFHVKFFSVVFLSMYLNSHHNLQFATVFFLTWHEIEIRKVRHCHDKLICNHHARVTFHDWLVVFHMFDMFVVFVNM